MKERKESKISAYLREITLFKINAYSIITMLFAVGINVVGGKLANSCNFPIWFDTVGTMMVAIQFGPLAGMFIGCIGPTISMFSYGVSPYYISVGGMVGFLIGLLFPRKQRDKLAIVSLAILAGLMTTFVCIPINSVVNNGYTGNNWGDALYNMLYHYFQDSKFNVFAAEAFVDVPDKVFTMAVALLFIHLEEKLFLKRGGNKNKKKKKTAGTGLSAVLVLFAVSLGMAVFQHSVVHADGNSEEKKDKKSYQSDYETITYGPKDGALTAEVNAVEQTKDGYIWVGTYSGLYKYDGVTFEEIALDDRIKTVMTLVLDSQERLWIGTNESGACCYDTVTGEKTFYDTSNGLEANSIREIGEDIDGNMYIGTVLSVSKISPDGVVKTYSEWDDIKYVQSFETLEDGGVVGITNGGTLFLIKNDMLMDSVTFNRDESVYYREVSYSGKEILCGTSTNIVDRYEIKNDKLKYVGNFEIPDFNFFNVMEYSPDDGGFFVCCENGLGFLDAKTYKSIDMSHSDFNGAVSDVCIDYQGNIWFASTKHGLMKYSKTPFANLTRRAGLDTGIVNSVEKVGDELFIGSDNGLQVINLKTNREIKKSYSSILDKNRIRNIFADSKGNIWFSTYAEKGLICVDKNENVTYFNEEAGVNLGGRCRAAMELSDGRILVASNIGLTYIKDGKIVSTIGEKDGLNNRYILSMVEREDGAILAGSDGDGIYIIKDDKVVGHIGEAEGMSSSVILRIVKCTGGYLYVTSNSIYYDNGTELKYLKNFPYSNNYDIKISDDGKCWITSSAGMYIVDENDLLSDENDYTFTLLDYRWGFSSTFTANSWNVLDGDNLYLCCIDGVRKITTKDYERDVKPFQPHLKSITYPEGEVTEKNGEFVIPATNGRIEFNIAINNYAMSNPLVYYHLEGFPDEGNLCTQSTISPLVFTDLPKGDYRFHISILDELTWEPENEVVVKVRKEAMMYEKTYFRVYLVLVLALVVLYIGWLFVEIRKRTASVRGLQKEVTTDAMTGLLNKTGSHRTLETTCDSETGILMMIDLDSFKLVNDIYGHDMGDRILIRFAELIKEGMHKDDIAGRIGGDEFIGFLKNTIDEQEVDKLTKFLNREMVVSAKEYMGEDMNIPLGVSIGAVRVPSEGTEFEELSKKADKALYVVKQNGKHGYSFYQKSGGEVEQESAGKEKNNLKQIKQIIGERNEGKGAYLVSFDKLQVVYKFLNRNDKQSNTNTGFLRFTLEREDGGDIPDEIQDSFEDYLIVNLKKNDVVCRYSDSFYVLCVGCKDDKYEDVADRLMTGWDEQDGHKEYKVLFEIEEVG